jgi:predicted AAA+ superfamily ATPase
MIARTVLQETIQNALDRSRVVALIGPRQCGKTTMARLFVRSDSINYFDLEDPLSLTRLDQPMTALQDLRGLVVIDEVQRRPDLFPILRVLGRPNTTAGAFSDPWQRFTGPAAPVIGVAGWADFDHHHERLQPG